ncbi:hypothetical protein BCV71DRAFT_231454 [Rhizopus microsporus]|uniref:Uncharacterized protein n=1 Tax=Rhizopus microsporus TaxID=58291 RepID=A0A1X0SDM7_RHIZD|nr:hypothetical protein BCV71DRAFT_231454 [Rhizopus microsporus]
MLSLVLEVTTRSFKVDQTEKCKSILSFYTFHNASWVNSIHFIEKGLDPRIFRFPKSFRKSTRVGRRLIFSLIELHEGHEIRLFQLRFRYNSNFLLNWCNFCVDLGFECVRTLENDHDNKTSIEIKKSKSEEDSVD